MWVQPTSPATPSAKTPARAAVIPAPPAGTHELTAEDISAFLDGYMPLQLAREDIAGAVVLVMKDGKILFSKGYGYADVKKKTPVTPDGTLFRPGSISKLFTWTSVMQLVEQGKLDLDRDVNDYLDFRIPPKFGKPITLRNIMTHTSGFQETAEDMGPKNLKPLGWYVKTHVPPRIFPPGVTPAYSNFATTMAGYIVERVSGLPFNDYVEQNIFIPLGMTHATFRQPLPAALEPMMSNGYKLGSQPAKPFELIQPWPAGSLSITASDISHFMLAHLQDGQFEGKQILRPETARLMHARAFENLPSMNAMALGFYEETRNGHRIIGHGGDTAWFHSDLHLIPDAGVGFFVSYNSAGKREIDPRGALWHAFLDRYFPYEPPQAETVATAAQDARTVTGRYLISRGFQTNFMRVFSVIGEPKVFPNDDGTITMNMFKDLNGQPKRFREIAPLLFREVNGQSLLGFKRNEAGDLIMVIDYPFMVGRQAHGSDDSQVIQVVLIFSLGVLLLTLLAWPVGAWIRWHFGKKLELSAGQRWPRLLTRLACVFDLVLVLAFAVFFMTVMNSMSGAGAAVHLLLRFGQLLGWLGAFGALVALYNAYLSWTDRGLWLWSKLGYSLTALACLSFTWFALAFHLLGWNLHY
jgi:CubicO group peptidase (beta-lactamase class C family)